MKTLEDLFDKKELYLYSIIVKPFDIVMLRKALDQKLKEDPDYEVFVPFRFWRNSRNLKRTKDYFLKLDWLLISNKGRVYTTRGNDPHFLTVSISNNGYKYIQVSINNKNNMFAMHRVLASLFVPPEKEPGKFNPDKLEINHIDGIKANIEITNLEWTTRRDNAIHAIDNGLNNSRIPIIGEVIFGKYSGYRFWLPSARQAVPYGFCFKGINLVCKGKRRHHKGVHWMYAGNEPCDHLSKTLPKKIILSLKPYVRIRRRYT